MISYSEILLPLCYLGPIQLYCRYYIAEKILIEQNDSYLKQSYRNRCEIYSANGRLSLSIPVIHEKGYRFKVKEARIDYATDWRRLHWKGIESAYNSSPYFEYYRDCFDSFYRQEFVFLVDLCARMNEEVLSILKIQLKPEYTNEFYTGISDQQNTNGLLNERIPEMLDLRELIHPKIKPETDKGFRIVEYNQVFIQKHGFIPNLSILDLIFNMGPEAGKVLNSSLVS